MIVAFIDQTRAAGRGFESICHVLQAQGVAVAPRSYRKWRRRHPSDQTLADAAITAVLWQLRQRSAFGLQRPEVRYGRRNMTAWLARSPRVGGLDGQGHYDGPAQVTWAPGPM